MPENSSPTLCVVICTYKREDYVYKNIEVLRENKDVFDHVVVVDNARTLDVSLADDFAEIIPNKNLGGSGGFTRGLMRAHDLGYTHVLLMDDDISFDVTAFRNAKERLASLPKENELAWLGFAMRPLDRPHIQYEMGSRWNGVKMMLNNSNLDMNDPRNLKRNQEHQNYNYSAWWSLIMPTLVVDRYGLPLPFFIKFDDIEYGLRRKDEPILFDNAWYICHEDFKKKYNAYLEYYLCRNAAITNALHFRGALFFTLLRYHWKMLKFLLTGKIIEMHLASLGIRDYLRGPAIFLDEDIVANNDKVRAIASTKIAKFPKAFAYLFECMGRSFSLLFKHGKAKRAWKENYKKLTSREYWEGLFA